MTYVQPENYMRPENAREADTDTLLEAFAEAQRVYNRCGGHKLAARMKAAMLTIEAELADRDIAVGGA